jgi:ankyrin repeat protein
LVLWNYTRNFGSSFLVSGFSSFFFLQHTCPYNMETKNQQSRWQRPEESKYPEEHVDSPMWKIKRMQMLAGHTPLHRAALEKNSTLVGELLEDGQDPNATTFCGDTVLSFACSGSDSVAKSEIIQALVARGANPFTKGPLGTTLLHKAAWEKDTNLMHYLKALGLKDKKPRCGQTAAYIFGISTAENKPQVPSPYKPVFFCPCCRK